MNDTWCGAVTSQWHGRETEREREREKSENTWRHGLHAAADMRRSPPVRCSENCGYKVTPFAAGLIVVFVLADSVPAAAATAAGWMDMIGDWRAGIGLDSQSVQPGAESRRASDSRSRRPFISYARFARRRQH